MQTRHLSLDIARGFAALAVVFTHWVRLPDPHAATNVFDATAAAALNTSPPSLFERVPFALGLLLPLFGAARVRRRLRKISPFLGVMLLAALSLAAVASLSGCSGAGLFAARKIPYSITVTATEGTLQRSTTVPLAIQ